MKKLLVFLVLICGFAAHAGEFIALDQELSLKSIKGNGFRRLELCKDSHCESFPQSMYLDYSQIPEDIDWDYIFAECRNFKSLNELLLYTDVFASIATFYIPSNTLRKLRTTKQLLSRIGPLGRLVGKRLVFDSGVMLAGSQIFEIPKDQLAGNQTYPEVTEAEIDFILMVFNALISDDEATYFFDSQMIQAVTHITKLCSSQLEAQLRQIERRECLGSCHGSTDVHSPSSNQIVHKSRLSSKAHRPSDKELIQLERYLNQTSP